MPSLDLLLHAHPVLGWWTGLWLLVAAGLVVRRGAPGGRVLAGWALGALTVVAVVPPRGGWVPGLARTCDLRAEHLLWPWDWFRQDPRMGLVAVMVVAGLATRRGRWVVAAAVLPVILQGVQYAVPSLARACSVPDVLHAWMGLAVGLAVGMVVERAAGRMGRRAPRAVAVALVVGFTLTALAAWTLRAEPAVDPQARVVLQGVAAGFPATEGPGPQDRAWLDAGLVPGSGTRYEDMARTALWDLRRLAPPDQDPPGLPPAGPATNWGYFWPRDGAFLTVALARTGQQDQAVELLSHVATLYLDPMYGFDARYLLSGDRVAVDPRRAQVDGCGWVLWAIAETARTTTVPAPVDRLRDRCTDQLLRATGGGSHLPAPGQDYWEQTTYDHLLGASAPVAAGLRAAATDYHALGTTARAEQVEQAAAGVRARIGQVFGPDYLRAGTHGGLDAAAAMLMPPFDPDPLPGVEDAWLGYQQQALRPGGGLAPGSAWKQDGISWTPEVALVAYTAAAAGQDDIAHHWLDWLEQHRAPWGSLPEKVDAQGRPGGPAPLGWTSALVLLTLTELSADEEAASATSVVVPVG